MDTQVLPFVCLDEQGRALWARMAGMAGLAPAGRYLLQLPTELDGELLDHAQEVAGQHGLKMSVVGDHGAWVEVQVEGYGVTLVRYLVDTQTGEDLEMLREACRWADPVA